MQFADVFTVLFVIYVACLLVLVMCWLYTFATCLRVVYALLIDVNVFGGFLLLSPCMVFYDVHICFVCDPIVYLIPPIVCFIMLLCE